MNILVLGGTIFLGRHIVQSAVERNHTVTLFNRGKHNPDLFPDLEKLRGDRDGNLSALNGKQWDAVIDTSGFVPRIVKDSVELLAENINNYTFISTISVYNDFSQKGIDEQYKTATIEDETIEEDTDKYYGPLKALCEKEVRNRIPNKSLIIRPGLITGPYDKSDRLTYWINRVQRYDEVLAPKNPNHHIQYIDVRDLAEWIIKMIEKGNTGTFNATGPEKPLALHEFLQSCRNTFSADTNFILCEDEFLLEQGVTPWTELPLWLPKIQEYKGFSAINIDKALSKGLTFRSLQTTLVDTYNWITDEKDDYQRKHGLSREKELELIEKYKA